MATTVDTLMIRIEADMSDVRRKLDNLDRDVKRGTSGAAASFKSLASVVKVAAIGVIVQQLGRAGMAAINLASDVEEMQSKSSVVFGKFRDGVVADLEEFGDAVGRSTFELEGMASSIQDTFVPMGFARGEAAKLSVDLTKLAVDVASFNNASDTDTMNAFQSALVGNHETVRRFGVVITEATLKQELLRMGIKRTGDEVTNAEKVQARMNLIINGTSDAHGDATRTADSYANTTKKLKAEFTELAAKIGEQLIPMAKDLTHAFIDALGSIEAFLIFIGKLPTHSSLEEKLEAEKKALEELKAAYVDQSWGQAVVQNSKNMIAGKERLIETLEREILTRKALATLEDTPLPPPMDHGPRLGLSRPDPEPVFDPTEEQIKIAGTNAVLQKRLTLQKRITELEIAGHTSIAQHKREELERFNLHVKFTDVQKDLGKIEAARMVALGHSGDQLTSQLIEQNKNLTASFEVVTAIQDGFTEGAEKSRGALLDLRDTITSINAGPNQDLIDNIALLEAHLGGLGPKLEGAREALEKLKNELASQQPMMQTFNDAISSMSQNLSSAFADMLMSGKSNLDGLKDIFKGFVKTIIAKAIELFVVNQIMNAIFGGVTGYTPLPSGQLFGGKAGGGTVQPRQPVLVGERGPELYVPSGAGAIMNSHNTGNLLGGGGQTVVNQVINVETGVSQTVKAEMLSLLPRIKQDTMAAVVDNRRRGGSFGQAFG